MMEWKEVELGSLVRRKIGYGIVQPGASPSEGVPLIKVNKQTRFQCPMTVWGGAW